MSRISIDVTPEEHQKLKAVAALKGMSIKEYVLDRTLGAGEEEALKELEALLDQRIESAKGGAASKRGVREIFAAERQR